MKKQELSIRAIARELGRAPSSISRELSRNRRELVERQPHLLKTITADNGTEFHSYK